MKKTKKNVFYHLLVTMIAVGACAGVSYGQLSVTISSPGSGTYTAPFSTEFNGRFKVSATVTNSNNNTAKVVFYQNDVPTVTDTSSPFELTSEALGQDTYTFRARACDTTGHCEESNELKLVIRTPLVVKMGQQIVLNGSPITLEGPNRYADHTDDIRNAIEFLGAGGGTIFFPCKLPPNQGIARYNIRETIEIPSNITLQGEGADEGNRCQISWNDVSWTPGGCTVNPATITVNGNQIPNPYFLLNKPMFKIKGGTSRVRFKDMWLLSHSEGENCWRRSNPERIGSDETTAIEMNTKNGGNITDVVFENISITTFTKGISAISNNTQEEEISNIKIRGYRPMSNHRQLYIDSKYAYNWDVQNLNVTGMLPSQGVVEIINAGKPTGFNGMNGIIKFLQLNCNGNFESENVPFCVQVEKHGGLYFRQLHHEGVNEAIVVKNISQRTNPGERTNPDPIVFDGSVATGNFYDASMKLYIMGGGVAAAPEIASAGLDEGRLRFHDGGTQSTVINCGETHSDVTPVYPTPAPSPSPTPQWHDLKMLFTHSERNRGAFFAQTGEGDYIKPHTTCPAGIPGLPDTNKIGGEYFDSGLLPTEAGTYSNVLNAANCPNDQNNAEDYAACMEGFFQTGGAVYVDGSFIVNRTINVPSGSQIVGTNGSALRLVHSVNDDIVPLLRINVLLPSGLLRVSNIVIRDLALKTQQTETIGISIVNNDPYTVSASSDFHFSGLTFQGFDKGIYAGRNLNGGVADPMIDGASFKNLSFFGNKTAVEVYSGNASNWNIMNLHIESNTPNAEGWYQTTGGHQGFQRVTCKGTLNGKMKDCIRLMMGSLYLTDLKQTTHVTNALTIENSLFHFSGIYQAPIFSTVLLRNNDFTSAVAEEGKVKIQGKAFITSMNNKYKYFDVGTAYQGNLSRLTHCGDTYTGSNNTVYPGLAETHPNLWVWVATPTRIKCGTRAVPWEDAVRLGGQIGDKPLVGNFSDHLREDLVIYRPGTSSEPQGKFLIKQSGGPYSRTINWGTVGDVGLVGKFFPNSRSQIVIFRPSTGDWWAYDPKTDTYQVWHWGQSGDVPFIGNFLDESGTVGGNMDDLAVYRPSSKSFFILNPRSGQWTSVSRSADYGENIHAGDFNGLGYDQIAQYQLTSGKWEIVDPRTSATYTVALATKTAGDVPVPGKYLPAAFGLSACTQIGVWRPSTQQFVVEDASPNCGSRTSSVVWGSNNDFLYNDDNNMPVNFSGVDDIPLTISTADGTLRRPAAYRPTRGVFPESIANGQWWIHDPLTP
jgi:hypothetical protein